MRSKKINLVVVPLLLTACSHNDGPLVQDVYNNQYDCARDWNTQTCKEENSSSGHGSSYVGGRYLGPAYYRNNREVSLRGNTLHPYSNLSVGRPIISSTAKSVSSSSPIRGGFGRSGFSFGG
jgi:hypothetical protein